MHYSPMNIFGCPGQQYFNKGRGCLILMNILFLFAIPLIIIFAPAVFLIFLFCTGEYEFSNSTFVKLCCCYVPCIKEHCDHCIYYTCIGLIFIPLFFGIGLAIGAVGLAILAAPVYLFQLYRILMMIFQRCRCCIN